MEPSSRGSMKAAVCGSVDIDAPSFRPFFAVSYAVTREFAVKPGMRRQGDRFAAAGRSGGSVVEGTPSRGMARQQPYASLEALRKLEARLATDLCERDAWPPEPDELHKPRAAPFRWFSFLRRSFPIAPGLRPVLWRPGMRKLALVAGSLGGIVVIALAALWWRLSSGPIELDIATPWLTAAIKANLGGGHEVEVGGTQLERDAGGRTALRIREIVVRDQDGTIVASAPKAEVGISGTGLIMGRIRAQRLSLVGAEMAVRIEPDSKITVFAGSNKRPFVTASAGPIPVITGNTASPITVAPPTLGADRRCDSDRSRRGRRPRGTARLDRELSTPAVSMAAISPRSASRAAISPSTISATASNGPSPTSI